MSWGSAGRGVGRGNSLILGNQRSLTAASVSRLPLHLLPPPNAAATDSQAVSSKDWLYFTCKIFWMVLSWFLSGLRTQQWMPRLWLSSPVAHWTVVPSVEAGWPLRSRLLQIPCCDVPGLHQEPLCQIKPSSKWPTQCLVPIVITEIRGQVGEWHPPDVLAHGYGRFDHCGCMNQRVPGLRLWSWSHLAFLSSDP